MRAKLFGMMIGVMSGRMVVSHRMTSRSMLNTHVVSRWLLDMNRNWYLILLRHSDHLHVVHDPYSFRTGQAQDASGTLED